jgi:sRNA-binding protein
MTSANGGAGVLAGTSGRTENGLERPLNNPGKPAAAALRVLAELFPQCFVMERWQPHRPLKIGIGNDLVAAGVLLPSECKVLRWYVSRRQYQAALANGGARYDLAGNVVGEVSAEQIKGAAAALAVMDAKAAALAIAARRAKAATRPNRAATGPTHKPNGRPPIRKAQPGKTSVRPPQPVTQSWGPPRHGLAELRAAYQARQAGAP